MDRSERDLARPAGDAQQQLRLELRAARRRRRAGTPARRGDPRARAALRALEPDATGLVARGRSDSASPSSVARRSPSRPARAASRVATRERSVPSIGGDPREPRPAATDSGATAIGWPFARTSSGRSAASPGSGTQRRRRRPRSPGGSAPHRADVERERPRTRRSGSCGPPASSGHARDGSCASTQSDPGRSGSGTVGRSRGRRRPARAQRSAREQEHESETGALHDCILAAAALRPFFALSRM